MHDYQENMQLTKSTEKKLVSMRASFSLQVHTNADRQVSILVSRKNRPLGLELGFKDLSVFFTPWGYVDRESFRGKDKAVCICRFYVIINHLVLSGDIKPPGKFCHIEHLSQVSQVGAVPWYIKRTNEFSASRWPGHTRRPAPKEYVTLR